MNVTRKVLYFVAIILLYCCKIFFLLYGNLTQSTFSVQGFLYVCFLLAFFFSVFFVSILNVYICLTLAILCLHRAVLLLQYNSNVKSTHNPHAWEIQVKWGDPYRAPCVDIFLSTFSDVNTLLQSSTKENIIPMGQGWKMVLWIFRRRCSWIQQDCYSSMLLCVAMLPSPTQLGETSILAVFLFQDSVLFRIQGSCFL